MNLTVEEMIDMFTNTLKEFVSKQDYTQPVFISKIQEEAFNRYHNEGDRSPKTIFEMIHGESPITEK